VFGPMVSARGCSLKKIFVHSPKKSEKSVKIKKIRKKSKKFHKNPKIIKKIQKIHKNPKILKNPQKSKNLKKPQKIQIS
jgi:hypothetical protein